MRSAALSRRLDIGIASYGTDPAKLQRAVESLQSRSVTDWRCFLVHNPSPGDERTREAICGMQARDSRIVPVWMPENVGYAGAVNELFRRSETEYTAYLDNDATVKTSHWDEELCGYLDRFHEIGMVFPNGGSYPINRGNYLEVLWGVGFCWMVTRLCMADAGQFDESLGHQEEADYCQRVRMAGYKCAAVPGIQVEHDATATSNPASIERINRGVVRWVDRWNKYFNGKNFNYHSPNVTRFEDWPPNALYLEEYWKLRLPMLNDEPEVITVEDREYDLIRVPRFKGFYRSRII